MKYIGKFDPQKDEIVRVMDKDGKIINPKLAPSITDEELIKAYSIMNLSRRQDDYQNKMQRQGRLLSFLSSTGQEACEVAYTMVIDPKNDFFVSGYRNNAAWLAMGQTVRNIMLYWAGNEAGAKAPEGVNSLPPNIIIGSQYSQATGIAFAEKYQGKKGVAVTTTGDGGMSEGETYEAMNFAKLHELPVVFVCENNKWAISTPTVQQTKSLNIAVKAIATGTPSIKVDGNDFLASYAVAKEAVEFARSGNGPVLIEFDTYRLGAHSSSDAPDVYRPKGEFEDRVPYEPLVRLKAYMIEKGIWSEEKQTALNEEQDKHIAAEFAWVEQNKNYPIEDIFNYQYAELTNDLKDQLAEAKEFFAKYPETKDGGHH
ncbi:MULTISPECIES: pyruvate dehydrogenase (acetyl-transferring) E1 component subunit alpha [Mesoplasma]|uniref:Pyruvate dehydrogenase E1 component subunit alpha n=1 Tax=Mesoplasma florum TaxID=2151 RepID=A0A2R3P6I5_MESFO|nr:MULTISPECIES: pyruvate dehydrogenase (acetyl-transferring) E1 component subunit alpha [Mesoplasma]AVN64093.1 pyruvate dehydrogenase (acetyl-transferring) E1 component subunit alpha [Mesoplasma florum]